jgi:hypothetical protein
MHAGLTDTATYRASQGTKIRNILALLAPDEQKIAHDISFQKSDPALVEQLPIATIEKIKILDLASGFVQFRFGRKEIDKEVYSNAYLKILTARSRLGVAPEDLYRHEEPARPETGHGTTRISTAVGVHKHRIFEELNVRPEFHGLLDPDQGYLPGAQIKFFDTAVRYGGGDNRVYLKSLHFLDIVSISPRDQFFKPLSWKVNTGLDREILRDGKEHLIYRLNSGGGFAYPSHFGGIMYLLGELDVSAGPDIRAFVSVAPGVSFGVTEQCSNNTKILLNVSGYWYEIGDSRFVLKASLGLNQRITQNNSLSLETSQEYMNSQPTFEIALRWNYYY